MNGTELNSQRKLNAALLNFTLLNADSGPLGVSGGTVPSEEDIYVLNNAVLLSDGTVLLADDGIPVVYGQAESVQAVPYESGMALEEGRRYTQSGKEYECFRSSGGRVYADLDKLSIYVKET